MTISNFNPENLSSSQLAECVNIYVERAMSLIRENNNEDLQGEGILISIMASVYNLKNNEYKILHKVSIGDSYSGRPNPTYSGNNCVEGASVCLSRYLSDSCNKPVVVRPMLAAPVVEEEDVFASSAGVVEDPIETVEEAEFEDHEDEESGD